MSPSAQAHAVLKSSEPAAGSELQTSPSSVLLTFTEDTDPALSFVHVLNQKGTNVEMGGARAVRGNAAALIVGVGTLPRGVYTVSWRVVSRDDGHVTAGAFAFGVGVSPAGALLPSAKTPSPSVLSVLSRWIFYSGIFLLLGCSAMALFLSRDLARAPPLASAGSVAAAVGLLGLVDAQRSDAGVAFSHLLGSSIGHAFLLRAVPRSSASSLSVVRPRDRPASRSSWSRLLRPFSRTSQKATPRRGRGVWERSFFSGRTSSQEGSGSAASRRCSPASGRSIRKAGDA
jgi:methionine-rich copper-binding protein CopC